MAIITGVEVALITSPESVTTDAVTLTGPGPVPLLIETQASPFAVNAESIIPALLRLAPDGIFGPRVNVTFTGSFTRTPFSSNTLAQICVDSNPPPPTTIISAGYEEGISTYAGVPEYVVSNMVICTESIRVPNTGCK